MMQNLNVDQAGISEVSKKAKDGHYQLACTKLFELTRGKVHEAAQGKSGQLDANGKFMLFEPIDHPNQWFDLSLHGTSTRGKIKVEQELEE
jgi:DNA primase large subunit